MFARRVLNGGAQGHPSRPHTTVLGCISFLGRRSTVVDFTHEGEASDKECRDWGEGSPPSMGAKILYEKQTSIRSLELLQIREEGL
jgi:hypothetical protein